MSDSEQLALTVLGWDGSGDIQFIVYLVGKMGVDLSALTQALLREQVQREVATHTSGRKYKLGELLEGVTSDNTHTEQEAWGNQEVPVERRQTAWRVAGHDVPSGHCPNCWYSKDGSTGCQMCRGTGRI